MCGIAGIIDIKNNRTISEETLLAMRDSLIHRGPDAAGIFLKPGIGLAHRRLSIIDLHSGQQPLFNQQEDLCIVFNGEIFNYKSLTQTLIKKGYQFDTQSDTETILHAWEEWGEDCVHQLRGMFAFVIWDKKKNTVFLARDRLGVKPLLYAITDDGYLIFASEHKALLKYPNLDKSINIKSIEDYFALGYICEPKTIYNAIHKLPAAHRFSIHKNQLIQPSAYWDLPFKKHPLNKQEAEKELIKQLKEAIDIRLVSEVPLGAFLSGGVDSSAVVALMSSLQKAPVNTCSISFDDKQYDESKYARLIANQYKTNHHEEIVNSDNFDLIDQLPSIYDEPYADSSALPTVKVCEIARKRVTVALSGDGADELMSGYRRHQFHLKEEAIRNKIPLWIRKPVFGLLAKLYPKADWAPQFLRAKSTFQALSKDSVSAYFHSVSQNNDDIRNQLYSDTLKKQLNNYHASQVFYQHAKNAPDTSAQSLIQYIDAKTYLIDDILTKVDRASMANSLEVRSPFLDHKWIEWVSGLDSQYKFDGREGKSLLKKAMEAFLPHDILYRKKMGFSTPLATWFRGPLKDRVEKTLLGDRLNNTQYFNRRFLKKINDEHQAKIKDHSVLIWSLIMFDGFLEKEGIN